MISHTSLRHIHIVLFMMLLIFTVTDSNAADCNNGSKLAADIFLEADRISARDQCGDLKVMLASPHDPEIPSTTSVSQNNTSAHGGTINGTGAGSDGSIVNSGKRFVSGMGKAVKGAASGIKQGIHKAPRIAKYAGCMVVKGISNFPSDMVNFWNRLAGNKWATIGPRRLKFDSVQEGNVINPTKRTFVAATPLDSDSVDVILTKVQGGANTHVAVCSHGRDGDSRLEKDTIITRNNPDGFVWNTGEMTDMLDRVISVQIDPAGTARHLKYTLKANKGPLVEPYTEEDSSQSSTQGPSQDTESTPPSNQNATTSTQCLVSSTQYFPKIRLRCGNSDKDVISKVSEDFLSDCPLIGGDAVKVQVNEKLNKYQITGRASGGEWCNQTLPAGEYSGPCSYEVQDDHRKLAVRTLYLQGKKIVASVIPKKCKPAQIGPGLYRVITENREYGAGLPSSIQTEESGLRIEGESLSDGVSELPSIPPDEGNTGDQMPDGVQEMAPVPEASTETGNTDQELAPWPNLNGKKASIIFSYMGDSQFTSFFQETARLKKIMENYDFNVLLKHDQVEPWMDLSEQDERIANIKDVPTKAHLFAYIKRLADEQYTIDIWIFSHGSWDGSFRASFREYSTQQENNDIVTPDDIKDLAGGDGGSSGYRALPIRLVHLTSCWGSRLAAAWQKIGANTVVGSRLANFYPTQTIPFAKEWAKGSSVVTAYREANTASSRTAVQTYIVGLAATSDKTEWGGCGLGNTPLGKKPCAKRFFVYKNYFNPDEWEDTLSGKQNMNRASEMLIIGERRLSKNSKWQRPVN